MGMSDTARRPPSAPPPANCTCPPSATKPPKLAEIALRERRTYLAFLAEVLAAEIDERGARRRTRRITEARFPRVKRLADFDLSAAPTIQPAQLAALASGATSRPASPSSCSVTLAPANGLRSRRC